MDDNTYRNLSLHRPAYQSSAYDYNVAVQLVTDGIKETALPQWIETSSYVLRQRSTKTVLGEGAVSKLSYTRMAR